MTNVSIAIKLAVALLLVAAIVATRFSSNKSTFTSARKRSRGLKGARNLQFTLPGFGNTGTRFSGGTISGGSQGGGSAGGTGLATIMKMGGVAGANGSGMFDSSGGSSGFINSSLGTAVGSSAGGASGDSVGTTANAAGTAAGLGTTKFAGSTIADGSGGFGGGLSPVGFNSVTTTIPGVAILGGRGGSKKGGSSGGGFTPPTTSTVVTPFSTGPTGGFGSGVGTLTISNTADGTVMGMEATGTSSVIGNAKTFGGGQGQSTNYFGSAGGLGSGVGTGAGTAGGTTKNDITNGIFAGVGTATGNFNNAGSGLFGAAGALSFPGSTPTI